MANRTITAQKVLDQNGYTTSDFDLADVEYWIDDCIDYINSRADSGIPSMTGTTPAKTVTVTAKANAALKFLLSIVLREAKKTSLTSTSATSGSSGNSINIAVGSVSNSESSSTSTAISAAQSINNAGNSPLVQMFEEALWRLMGDYNWNRAII